MPAPLLPAWAGVARPVIGMLHALPLPGAPRAHGDMSRVLDAVLRDAEALASGGVHGLMLENFGDAPFFPAAVPPMVVAALARIATELKRRVPLPLGINVLRNDGLAALSIAQAAGAEYIRVNVLTGARVADQGVLEGIAHDLLRLRRSLGAESVRILADVNVKHAAALGAPRAIEDEVEDTIQRGGADAIVTSGSGTGKATSLDDVRRARGAAHGTPVFVGSGISAATIGDFIDAADGFIVGTSLKRDGIPDNPVDARRVQELMRRLG